MAKKENKKFWIGKGTLGKIRHNEEIPEGYIDPERMKQLEAEDLIGEKVVVVDKTETAASQNRIKELEETIKDLANENKELAERIKELESEMKDGAGKDGKIFGDGGK